MSVLAAPPFIGLSRSARWRRVMEGLPIRTEGGGIAQMRFSQSQQRLWDAAAPMIDQHRKLWFIVLKGRQMYSSTFYQALTFVRTMEQPGTLSIVIAQDLDTSHALFEKSKLFYEHLPLPKLKSPRLRELEFPFPEGSSRYRVISAGVAAKGRGTTQTCAHLSETAFWQHPEFFTGMMQAMPDLDDTILTIESTANGKRGVGKLFYEEWMRAIGYDSDLQPIFLCWKDMPKYRRKPGLPQDDWTPKEAMLSKTFGLDGEQLAWRRYAIKTKTQGDSALFDQEYPISPEVAFIATGQPAFDRDSVLALRAGVREPSARYDLVAKKWSPSARGALSVWEEPIPGVPYVIGADTAEGLFEREGGYRVDGSGDYAAAEVINMRTLEQVASIHGRIPPWEFSDWLAALGRWYNSALLAVEVNNHGHTTQDRLIREFYYPNLMRWRGTPDKMLNTQPRRLYGWLTNSISRPLMIDAGRRVINTQMISIHEEKLLAEIDDFSLMDNGKYEAEYGHDDRVIALLIALRAREENYHEKRLAPQLTEVTLPSNVRIAEERDIGLAAQRRRISKMLKQKVDHAVRHWMTYLILGALIF